MRVSAGAGHPLPIQPGACPKQAKGTEGTLLLKGCGSSEQPRAVPNVSPHPPPHLKAFLQHPSLMACGNENVVRLCVGADRLVSSASLNHPLKDFEHLQPQNATSSKQRGQAVGSCRTKGLCGLEGACDAALQVPQEYRNAQLVS